MEVTLKDGKYSIVIEKGEIVAYRYGKTWRNLTGDNLIFNLVNRVSELTEAANKAADQLDEVNELVNKDGGDAIGWLIDNHGENKELAENLRDATEA